MVAEQASVLRMTDRSVTFMSSVSITIDVRPLLPSVPAPQLADLSFFACRGLAGLAHLRRRARPGGRTRTQPSAAAQITASGSPALVFSRDAFAR